MNPVLIALGVYVFMSLLTFAAFALDKRAARADRWRTRERTLHIMELLGGWPGALLAMRMIRHKNRKGRYVAVLALIIALHAGAWAAVVWSGLGGAAP